jgi:hypothetical protein
MTDQFVPREQYFSGDAKKNDPSHQRGFIPGGTFVPAYHNIGLDPQDTLTEQLRIQDEKTADAEILAGVGIKEYRESDEVIVVDGADEDESISFDCPFCDKSFLTDQGLKVHTGKVHGVRDESQADN